MARVLAHCFEVKAILQKMDEEIPLVFLRKNGGCTLLHCLK